MVSISTVREFIVKVVDCVRHAPETGRPTSFLVRVSGIISWISVMVVKHVCDKSVCFRLCLIHNTFRHDILDRCQTIPSLLTTPDHSVAGCVMFRFSSGIRSFGWRGFRRSSMRRLSAALSWCSCRRRPRAIGWRWSGRSLPTTIASAIWRSYWISPTFIHKVSPPCVCQIATLSKAGFVEKNVL